MKKILLLTAIISLFTSCTKDDDVYEERHEEINTHAVNIQQRLDYSPDRQTAKMTTSWQVVGDFTAMRLDISSGFVDEPFIRESENSYISTMVFNREDILSGVILKAYIVIDGVVFPSSQPQVVQW